MLCKVWVLRIVLLWCVRLSASDILGLLWCNFVLMPHTCAAHHSSCQLNDEHTSH